MIKTDPKQYSTFYSGPKEEQNQYPLTQSNGFGSSNYRDQFSFAAKSSDGFRQSKTGSFGDKIKVETFLKESPTKRYNYVSEEMRKDLYQPSSVMYFEY